MELKRFNAAGVAAFQDYLDQLRGDPSLPPPFALLDDAATSEPLDAPIMAEPAAFASRMDFACWLHAAAIGSNTTTPLRDAGFWVWLSLRLFDQICPSGKAGRAVREDARYIPQLDNKLRYYRHALLGPYLVFNSYRDDPGEAAALLCGSLAKLSDEAYRLFVENQLTAYPCAVAVLTKLYFDAKSKKLRRGAQSKDHAGSIRRLAKILAQYARTYDLDLLSSERLMHMLPQEFDPWNPNLELDV